MYGAKAKDYHRTIGEQDKKLHRAARYVHVHFLLLKFEQTVVNFVDNL